MSDNNEKLRFAERLNALCDKKSIPLRGRQVALKKQFNVSQEAVRKWLNGESMPGHENRLLLCKYFAVSYEWLSTGKESVSAELQKLNIDINDPGFIEFVKLWKETPKHLRPHLASLAGTVQQLSGIYKLDNNLDDKKRSNDK